MGIGELERRVSTVTISGGAEGIARALDPFADTYGLTVSVPTGQQHILLSRS